MPRASGSGIKRSSCDSNYSTFRLPWIHQLHCPSKNFFLFFAVHLRIFPFFDESFLNGQRSEPIHDKRKVDSSFFPQIARALVLLLAVRWHRHCTNIHITQANWVLLFVILYLLSMPPWNKTIWWVHLFHRQFCLTLTQCVYSDRPDNQYPFIKGRKKAPALPMNDLSALSIQRKDLLLAFKAFYTIN